MAQILRVQVSCTEAGSYEVRVVDSPGGEPHQLLVPPFSPATARAVCKVLEGWEPWRLGEDECAGLRTLGILSDDGMRTLDDRNRLLGQRLYTALFPSSDDPDSHVAGALQAALDRSLANREEVSLQIRFDHKAVELAALPWELLCDPHGQYLAATSLVHLTRYITFGQAVAPLPVSDRLEVLTVTPRPRVGVSDLGPGVERQEILKAFKKLSVGHRLHVEACEPPTYDRLCQLLNQRPYHVIHFDGHGGFLARCPDCGQLQRSEPPVCLTPGCRSYGRSLEPNEGCLAFEDGSAERVVDLVTTTDLATSLTGRGVLLFVASACQSAMVGGSSVFASVGPSLILAGLPASVAMQFSLDTQLAVKFTAEFYAALAQSKSIAAAASAGRAALFRSGQWYVPAVYLRDRDGEGFLFRYHSWVYLRSTAMAQPDPDAMRPRDAAPYKFLSPYEITDKSVFFGRENDTARLLEDVLHRPLVVLSGLQGVGKTSLVNAGLTPALLARDYLVLTLREYNGDPVEGLRESIAASPALDVKTQNCRDLRALLGAVMETTGRRLVVVFDEFDKYLQYAGTGERSAFAAQVADCIETFDPSHCCLILVVRDDIVGRLPVLLPGIHNVLHSLFPLEPLTRDQARQAIEGPLLRHVPRMRFDPAFLEGSLLKDLASKENTVNPSYLQIVCRTVYDAARRASPDDPARQAEVQTIGPAYYPAEGVEGILGRYLKDAVSRLEPTQRDLAYRLLKPMTRPKDVRVFVSASRLSEVVDTPVRDVQAVLDALLKDGLLEPRPQEDGGIAYSVGHTLLAAEVQSWFDPEEARDQCAQAALDRDWDAWYEEWQADRRQSRATADPADLLVSADHLREIRVRRPRVIIRPEQMGLLLRSAVQQRCDMEYWAAELSENKQALHLLLRFHDGPAPDESREDQDSVQLAAGGLGLGQAFNGHQGIARAAVAYGGRSRRDGAIRHAAALVLAALARRALPGESAVSEALAALQRAAPTGWRQTQALAQMRAAGLGLQERPEGRRRAVLAWAFALALWAEAGSIAVESFAAGLGAAFGLSICLLASTSLRSGDLVGYAFRGFFLQPLGLPLGLLAVAGARMASMPVGGQAVRRPVVKRIVGFGLGFTAGLAILWLPVEVFLAITLANGIDMQGILALVLTDVLGGMTWGLGIALGLELWMRVGGRFSGWAPLAGGLGGATACAAILAVSLALSDTIMLTVPMVGEPVFESVSWLQWAEACLVGFGIGVGLTGGWELGRRLWSWMRPAA